MKEGFDDNRGLTTADIARGDRPLEAIAGNRPLEAKPADGPGMHDAKMAEEQRSSSLFPGDEAQELRSRWDSTQTRFVDEPRNSVEEADTLVAATIKRLADIFAQERSTLEAQWDRGDNVSTEDLRLALQRYRSFFTRLLSV